MFGRYTIAVALCLATPVGTVPALAGKIADSCGAQISRLQISQSNNESEASDKLILCLLSAAEPAYASISEDSHYRVFPTTGKIDFVSGEPWAGGTAFFSVGYVAPTKNVTLVGEQIACTDGDGGRPGGAPGGDHMESFDILLNANLGDSYAGAIASALLYKSGLVSMAHNLKNATSMKVAAAVPCTQVGGGDRPRVPGGNHLPIYLEIVPNFVTNENYLGWTQKYGDYRSLGAQGFPFSNMNGNY